MKETEKEKEDLTNVPFFVVSEEKQSKKRIPWMLADPTLPTGLQYNYRHVRVRPAKETADSIIQQLEKLDRKKNQALSNYFQKYAGCQIKVKNCIITMQRNLYEERNASNFINEPIICFGYSDVDYYMGIQSTNFYYNNEDYVVLIAKNAAEFCDEVDREYRTYTQPNIPISKLTKKMIESTMNSRNEEIPPDFWDNYDD